MKRYWLDSKLISNEVIVLKDEGFHHIFQVCRHEVGDQFEMIAEPDAIFFVEVIEVQKRQALVKILKRTEVPQMPKPCVHLALSIPKFDTLEWIIEKAVELGASDIQLFFSDYSFIRSRSKWPSAKMERWEKIITSSLAQSRRPERMPMTEPRPLSELLEVINQKPAQKCLFLYEGLASNSQSKTYARSASLKEALNNVDKKQTDDIWLFIGSEGGFSESEVELFNKYKIEPVSLGQQILRVETACLSSLSILKYELSSDGPLRTSL